MMDRPSLRSAFLGVLLLLIPSLAAAQSPENWQQRVAYDMDITLHADDHEVTGTQTVTYANNSPDTLETLYYHLYFEAFEPTSMMAERNRQLPDPDGRIVPRIFQLGPDEQGWYEVRSLAQDGEAVDFTINDTVLRVDLAEPIPPGTSTTFAMNWRSQVPLQTRRSGRDSRGGGVDFTMTQWYPKIAEYDERGWHADPYVNREFYAPFGTFDVRITLPAQYTVGATGLLQNPDEVGHGYDLAGSGTWRPEDGIPEADSLTWHFVAENVHDFAWAADPDYVHDKVEADGTTHHILYKPDVAASWKDLQKRMPPLTRFFESKFGDYPYPQMTVAQGGDGGMEYPMFTAVAGYDNPEFEEKDGPISILGTTVHEFAHMWYHSALGTNESDYAWMDEGFTTYATEEGMAHLLGREPNHTRSRQSFVYMQKMGLAEPFSTPADWFQTNTAYGITSYPGGQMFVDMMGYVIGDEQQSEWLHRYTRQRLYQHPDPFDIELFAEQVSGLKLDWYFWQFTHSTRQLDDAITDLDQRQTADGVEVDLTLERKGEVRMPQDVKLTLEDGSTQWVNIPLLIMHGHKPVGNDWIVTDPWPWVTPKKTFSFTVPSPVTKAEIDPQGDTPDVNGRLPGHDALSPRPGKRLVLVPTRHSSAGTLRGHLRLRRRCAGTRAISPRRSPTARVADALAAGPGLQRRRPGPCLQLGIPEHRPGCASRSRRRGLLGRRHRLRVPLHDAGRPSDAALDRFGLGREETGPPGEPACAESAPERRPRRRNASADALGRPSVQSERSRVRSRPHVVPRAPGCLLCGGCQLQPLSAVAPRLGDCELDGRV